MSVLCGMCRIILQVPFRIAIPLKDHHPKILKINMLLGVKFEDVRHTKTFIHEDKYINA